MGRYPPGRSARRITKRSADQVSSTAAILLSTRPADRPAVRADGGLAEVGGYPGGFFGHAIQRPPDGVRRVRHVPKCRARAAAFNGGVPGALRGNASCLLRARRSHRCVRAETEDHVVCAAAGTAMDLDVLRERGKREPGGRVGEQHPVARFHTEFAGQRCTRTSGHATDDIRRRRGTARHRPGRIS